MQRVDCQSLRFEGEDFIDPALERKLLRKLDWYILPYCMLLYLVGFLTRGNIGNALSAGMQTDLKLTDSDANTAVSIVYATYILGETPCSVLLRKVGPWRLLTTLMLAWSAITVGTAFVKTGTQLIVLRLLLGAVESGLFPCLSLYLTQFYYRDEQAKRVALLFTASALSSAVGGLLAYGLVRINASGLVGWQWLYVVEGILSFLVACSVYFVIADHADQAWYLTAEEKQLVRQRKARAAAYVGADDERFTWPEFRRAVGDVKLYMAGLTQFGADICLYGFSTFLPVIIKGLGFDTLQAQALTVPVMVWASIVVATASVIADKVDRRMIFMLTLGLFPLLGYGLLLAPHLGAGPHYLACFFIATGLYVVIALNNVVVQINHAGHYKRAVSVGLQQSMGNAGGIVAGQLYRSKWKPNYQIGHAVSLGGIGIALVSAVAHWTYLAQQNRRKDSLTSEEVRQTLEKGGGAQALGDAAPTFRYKW